MNDYNSERSKAWNTYTSLDPTPSQTGGERESPWKNNYASSMNAISFGFVATAILIAMFLIMAIFEHLLKPTSLSSDQPDRSSMDLEKFRPQEPVSMSYSSDCSVVMPGETTPSHVARLAPLPPCPKEGVLWPSHQHDISLPSNSNTIC